MARVIGENACADQYPGMEGLSGGPQALTRRNDCQICKSRLLPPVRQKNPGITAGIFS
jgi:hypothetical protein